MSADLCLLRIVSSCIAAQHWKFLQHCVGKFFLGDSISQSDLSVFPLQLEAIVQDSKGSGAISSMDAINLRPDAQVRSVPQVLGLSYVCCFSMTLGSQPQSLQNI
jgi:hypothetical protein